MKGSDQIFLVPDMAETTKEEIPKIKLLIQQGDFEGFKTKLEQFLERERSKIINYVHEEQAPFFKACLLGRVDMVDFMIRKCGADIELRCRYILTAEDFNDLVTPLWVSVSEQHLSVVKILMESGANINASTTTDSSPVRCACYCTNYEIVKYLVENGADIHKPNVYGGTCLMNATRGSVQLCEYLINNGALVNATTSTGHTALYYAITTGRLDLVRLLLNNGAFHYISNKTRDHILMVAAINGSQPVFNYIKDNIVMKLSCLINGYELLGATLVDDFDDMEGAIMMWKNAMALRYADLESPLRKILPEEPLSVYAYQRETSIPSEVDALVPSDKDKIYMQSLLMRERILGSHHDRTITEIRYRGAVFADASRYQRAVDLWKYAYQLQRESSLASNSNVISDMVMFGELIREMLNKQLSGNITEQLQAVDIVDVLVLAVTQIQEFSKELSVRPVKKDTWDNYKMLLLVALHFMNFFSSAKGQDVQENRFLDEVQRAVTLAAVTEHGERLLHLAVDYNSSKVEDSFISEFPSIDVVRHLLNAGADVNVVDCDKNSALHKCIISWKTHTDSPSVRGKEASITQLLLQHNVHVDAQNNNKDCPLGFLQKLGLVCPVKHTTLKCKAAKVVIDNALNYKGVVPIELCRFVEMHG